MSDSEQNFLYNRFVKLCKIEKKIAVLRPARFYHSLSLKIVSEKIENFQAFLVPLYFLFPFFGDVLVRNMVSV